MSAGERQAGREVGVFFWGEVGAEGGAASRRLSLSRAEINHGTEAIMCNSSPARLVTLVT